MKMSDGLVGGVGVGVVVPSIVSNNNNIINSSASVSGTSLSPVTVGGINLGHLAAPGCSPTTTTFSPAVIAAAAGQSLCLSSAGGTTTMNVLTAATGGNSTALNSIPILSGGGSPHHQQQQHLQNCNAANANTQNMADYLAQLIKDKKQLAIFPNLFLHVDRVLDEEITRVRSNLFHLFGVRNEPLDLPEACGPVISMSEKVYVPVKEYPDLEMSKWIPNSQNIHKVGSHNFYILYGEAGKFNFVGRILGPRGMTAKQLEQETGCKIMVRGKGSMRDKKKEEQNRGKPNWEHLNDELHVLITVDDSENRGKLKLQRAIDEVGKLLVPVAEGEDELKKRQLMELAIINGTYRDSKESRNSNAVNNAGTTQLVTSQVPLSALRAATPLGAPLIISPHRLSNGLGTGASPGGPPPLLAQSNESLLYAASPYTTSDYATYLSLAEYSPDHVGKMSAVRRLTGLRDHPYLPKTDPSSLLH